MKEENKAMRETPDQRRQRALIEGLVGEEHRRRYLTQPLFRASVEQFASLLPVFMRGLAAETDEREAEFQEQVRTLERTLTPIVQPPPISLTLDEEG